MTTGADAAAEKVASLASSSGVSVPLESTSGAAAAVPAPVASASSTVSAIAELADGAVRESPPSSVPEPEAKVASKAPEAVSTLDPTPPDEGIYSEAGGVTDVFETASITAAQPAPSTVAPESRVVADESQRRAGQDTADDDGEGEVASVEAEPTLVAAPAVDDAAGPNFQRFWGFE